MREIYMGIVILYIPLVLLLAMITFVVRMKNKRQIHYVFIAFVTTIFIWAIGATVMEHRFRINLPTKDILVYIAYIGIILSPVGVFFLGLVFANTSIKFRLRHLIVFIIPLISIVMLLTNNNHNLFYKYMEYEDLTISASLGEYFIVHTIYSYVCIIVGMFFLTVYTVKNAGFFSKQSLLIIMGLAIPFVYNVFLTTNIIEVRFYSNVLSFFITGVCFFFAIFKFKFLSIVPVALRSIVDLISDSFVVINEQYKIIDYNKTFADTFGKVLTFSRNESILDILKDNESIGLNREVINGYIETAQTQGESIAFEHHIGMENFDKYFWIEITPIIKNNLSIGTIILFKDITQSKKDLEIIERNHSILMEQERLVSLGQLVGGIAHNLRTPIMSIAGGIEGIRDLVVEYKESIDDLTVTKEDHYEIAEDIFKWLHKLKPYCAYMSDVIAAVKGQTVQYGSSAGISFTIEELCKRMDILMKHELKRFHCELELDLQVHRFKEINGEINVLIQVFDNIIINAIQAYKGKRGKIHLRIKKEKEQILFIFRDNAGGIKPEIKEKLFKEMVTTKGKDGTGLGLYMSHSTIKGRFGGNLWFESEYGKGTTFYVSIPE